MPEIDLSDLQGQLLKTGVAPGEVRRTIAELEDHFDDLVAEGLDDGQAPELARSNAKAALGEPEDIARAVRAQPNLRSWAFRYPRLARVVYPLTCLALLPVAPLFIGYAHATQIARWTACLLLGGLVTAAMFLVLQLAIRFS
jgi:uncharacterized membrane protein